MNTFSKVLPWAWNACLPKIDTISADQIIHISLIRFDKLILDLFENELCVNISIVQFFELIYDLKPNIITLF